MVTVVTRSGILTYIYIYLSFCWEVCRISLLQHEPKVGTVLYPQHLAWARPAIDQRQPLIYHPSLDSKMSQHLRQYIVNILRQQNRQLPICKYLLITVVANHSRGSYYTPANQWEKALCYY